MVIKAFGLTSGRIMKTASVTSKSAPIYSQYRIFFFFGVCVCFLIFVFTNGWCYVKIWYLPLSLGCCDPAPEGEKHNSAFPEY